MMMMVMKLLIQLIHVFRNVELDELSLYVLLTVKMGVIYFEIMYRCDVLMRMIVGVVMVLKVTLRC